MATTKVLVGTYTDDSGASGNTTRIVSALNDYDCDEPVVRKVAPTVLIEDEEEDQAPQVVGQVRTLWDNHPSLLRKDYENHLETNPHPEVDRFDWEMLGHPELVGTPPEEPEVPEVEFHHLRLEDKEPEPPPEPQPDPDLLLHSFNEGDLVNFVENYEKGGFIQFSSGGGENIGVVTQDTPGEENIHVNWEYSKYSNPPPEYLPRWYVEKNTDPAAIVKLFNKKLENQQNIVEDGDTVRARGYPGSIGKLDYLSGDWANVTWHPESKTFPPGYLEKKLLQPIPENQLDLTVDLSELKYAKDRLESDLQRQQHDAQKQYSDLRQRTDADITTLRMEKEELEGKVVNLSQDREQLHTELNATREFTASLSDQLAAVMKEVQDLKDAGKQEEAAAVEQQEVMPVLRNMKKRDIAKSFIKTIGKTVGREVLVRIAQMSGYDFNWLLKIISGG
jgi:hypothetical protein